MTEPTPQPEDPVNVLVGRPDGSRVVQYLRSTGQPWVRTYDVLDEPQPAAQPGAAAP